MGILDIFTLLYLSMKLNPAPIPVAVCVLVVSTPVAAIAQTIIVSADGDYLGQVSSNRYGSDSICNEYGTFGSPYGNGIFNKYGTHGGEYSATGAYNRMAQNPPALIENGKIVGFITKNGNIRGRIDPDVLRAYVCDQ